MNQPHSHLPQPSPPCSAVLLAAGLGRRMGQAKALLEVKGQWMLPRLIESLAAGGCVRVHVVIRPEHLSKMQEVVVPKGVHWICNPTPEAGRTGSVLCGLQHLPTDHAVLIHSCDIPLLSADAVRQLLKEWARTPDSARLLARLRTPGGQGGHPLLVGSGLRPELETLAADTPLRELLHRDSSRLLSVVRRADPGPFLNVNTPEQLALLESLLDSSPGLTG